MKKIDKHISENVIKILVAKGAPKKKINNKYNFIKSKDIDSLNIILLISEIEKKFLIKFSKNDLLKKDFHTVNGITRIIFKKKK